MQDTAYTPCLTAAQARRRGLCHTGAEDCQDSTAICTSADGHVRCIAVADGAGSAAASGIGSRLAAETGAKLMAEHFMQLFRMPEEAIFRTVQEAVLSAIRAEAQRMGIRLRQFATTLLLAAMDTEGRSLLFRVGDGCIVGRSCSGAVQILSRYEHTIARNVTTFITDGPEVPWFVEKRMGKYTGLMLFSDGVEEGLAPGRTLSGLGQRSVVLSHMLLPEAMEAEMEALFLRLQRCRCTDDLSMAALADHAAVPEVLAQWHRSSRYLSALLYGSLREIGRPELRKLMTMLEQLAACPEGMSARTLARTLHSSPRYISRYMERFEMRGILERRNGRYTLWPEMI